MLKPMLLWLGSLTIAAVAVPGSRAADAVSPSARPRVPAQCPWVTSRAPIQQRVTQLLGRMSLQQKLHELHGIEDGTYVGEIPAIPSLCIPALTMQDGPGGVGDGMKGVTQLPAPIALAASWDDRLARKYGRVIGAEQRDKGVMVDLGPTLNLARDPRWGRAFETYGEDPYLTGRIGTAYVRGVQGTGTMAQIKHLAAYNQETNRNTPADNVIVDERTLQELYLPQFATIIRKARPASLMCSYNYLGGKAACGDAYLLTRVLRQQFGFRGFVVSDWGGTHDTLASARAGMNIEMPSGKYYGDALGKAVASGTVPVSVIDALVRPILAEMFRFHRFTRKPTGSHDAVVTTPQHVALARKVAEQGTVLLKNADYVLPLSAAKLHSIAVIGSDAGDAALTVGGGSAHVNARSIVTPYQGIVARAGTGVRVRHAQGNTPVAAPPVLAASYLKPASGSRHGLTGRFYRGTTLSGKAVVERRANNIDFDWKRGSPAAGIKSRDWSARWTGKLVPPTTGRYAFALTSDDGSRLFVDGKLLIDNWGDHASNTKTAKLQLTAGQPVDIEIDYYQAAGEASLRLGWRIPNQSRPRQQARLQRAVKLAAASDVAVVFAGDQQTEGSDLADLDLPGNQNLLIAAVAAANPNTIVVLHTGSAVTMPWLGAVKGVIEAWYPGQEDGHAIAAVLFGDVNPSAKLPVTFPRHLADVPASTKAQWPGVGGRVEYSEGLDVGYRWYDSKRIAPLFAFGHGLSYTTFAFDHLEVTHDVAATGVVHATVEVTNTGHRRGAEVVQLYVGHPKAMNEPPKQLAGFRKIMLAPGQTRRVTFHVPAREFATWDTHTHDWRMPRGDYRIMLGDASDHLPVQAVVHVVDHPDASR